ncbi:hypothetical protein J2S59_001379 [Nocardioides massiliensis]|uniref:Peptidase M14 domain-containing protein n=3 Tax=Nocardioides massiliensis TaxID=1325935 RepID=A0ABT9NNY8_9ACTN|nr:M14 family zinc carboxypeptidase [Nocardioides massiliensis]MDP9821570.1 hypothetical protein [Nocardioides massiliensis]
MLPTVRLRAAALGSLASLALAAGLLSAPSTAAGTPADASADASVPSIFSPQVVTVDTPTRADRARLQRLGLDLTEHGGHDYVEVILHSRLERDRLRRAGFRYDVRIPDLLQRSARNNARNIVFAAENPRTALPSGRNSYRTLRDYEADLKALAKQRPRLVRHFTLKRPTLDGNRLHAVEIGQGVKQPPRGKPTFVILGLHHAREWPSGELTMEFATDLVKSYGKDPRITRLLRRARVVAVPVVNPDGFDLSRTDGGLLDLQALNPIDPLGGSLAVLATPGQAYKRKNCRLVDGVDQPDGTCRLSLASPGGNGLGVDLNRNYGGFWGGPGAAGDLGAVNPDSPLDVLGPLSATYRGAAPFSEPETQNVRDLIASRQTTMMISNHTFSNLILRPNGVNPKTLYRGKPMGNARDEAALKALGARMAATNGYTNQHGWELYDTTGTTEDWSYNATGGFGYTFEIGAEEFHPPFEKVVEEYVGAGKHAGKGNREAFLIALEHAADTRHHGVLKGTAPRGTVLRLTKKFRTPTWTSSIPDAVSSTLRVGPKGTFRWVVNPSTRPIAEGPERYTLTCSRGGKVLAAGKVRIERGQVKTLPLRGCR